MLRNTIRTPNRLARPLARRGQASRGLRAESLEDRRLLAISTMDLTTGLTPTDLAQALLGGGVAVSNVSVTGDPRALGLFSGATSEGLGIDAGVVLSSGAISDAAGPNDSDSITTTFLTPGDTDLNTLVPQGETHDAAVLEFDFTVTASPISFLYVFASDEYNEFAGSQYNDVFGFFLDGQNIALIPNTTTPVSINNVNKSTNSQFYNNNDPSDFAGATPFLTQADGFTDVFQALSEVSLGTHHIKLAVADTSDFALDSWVFLKAGSFVSGTADMTVTVSDAPDPINIYNPLTYTLTATNLGPDPAQGVMVEDVLPASVSFVSVSSSQGSASYSNGTVTANLGAINAGASATVTVVVTPNVLGPVVNTATVSAVQPDPNEDNNSGSQTTTVETPTLRINDVQVFEGNTGTSAAVFTVSLNATNVLAATSVHYNTVDITAQAGVDYQARAGVLVIAPGALTGQIIVPIIGDFFNEVTETFAVHLTNPINADLVDDTGIATIVDNDPLPNFYVSDVYLRTTSSGNYTANFTVALDRASGRTVGVSYATYDGTALDGTDYQGRAGSLTFTPGMTTITVSVPVMTSPVYSPNKKFYVRLDDPLNALVADPEGAGTIIYAAEQQGEYIVDDGDAAYSQTAGWANLTNTLGYNLDYNYASAGNGSATATWNFVGVPNGEYQVFARWSAFSNRATNAPYTILDLGVPVATVRVNQQQAPAGEYSNGYYWQSLGTFSTTTNNLAVRLSNDANGYVVADAIRIVGGGIDPAAPEMDVSANDRSIITGDSTPAYEDATDFGYTPELTDSHVATFKIFNSGNADLHLSGAPPVSMGGANPGDFLVVTQPAATVAPGRSTTFQLMFHPTAAGTRTAVVSIANDDDSEHPYTFTVQGNGMAEAVPLAHNAVLPQDVNGDLRVTPNDMLIVINNLLSQSAAPAAVPAAAEPVAEPAAAKVPMTYFIDVNADGRLSPTDLLGVINYLLHASAAPQAAAPAAAPLATLSVDEALVLFDDTTTDGATSAMPRVELPVAKKAAPLEFAAATDRLLSAAAVDARANAADDSDADETLDLISLALSLED